MDTKPWDADIQWVPLDEEEMRAAREMRDFIERAIRVSIGMREPSDQ